MAQKTKREFELKRRLKRRWKDHPHRKKLGPKARNGRK